MFEDGCLRARSRSAQSGTQERNRVRRRQPKNSGFRKCQPDETTQQLHLTGPIHVPWGEYREENGQNTGTPGPGQASQVFTRLQSRRMEGCFRGNDQNCGNIMPAHLVRCGSGLSCRSQAVFLSMTPNRLARFSAYLNAAKPSARTMMPPRTASPMWEK